MYWSNGIILVWHMTIFYIFVVHFVKPTVGSVKNSKRGAWADKRTAHGPNFQWASALTNLVWSTFDLQGLQSQTSL